jgi:hypothetical protein
MSDDKETRKMLEEISNKVNEGVEGNKKHYKDDDVRFEKIGKTLHELTEKIDKVLETHNDIILPHITAVSPILAEYQEKQETERTFIRIGASIKKYGFWIAFFGTIATSVLAVKGFFTK